MATAVRLKSLLGLFKPLRPGLHKQRMNVGVELEWPWQCLQNTCRLPAHIYSVGRGQGRGTSRRAAAEANSAQSQQQLEMHLEVKLMCCSDSHGSAADVDLQGFCTCQAHDGFSESAQGLMKTMMGNGSTASSRSPQALGMPAQRQSL